MSEMRMETRQREKWREEEEEEETEASARRGGRRGRWTMHTWVMEDNVGDIVGENCLGCCLLESPPIGRVRGLSGTRRRGEVFMDACTMGA